MFKYITFILILCTSVFSFSFDSVLKSGSEYLNDKTSAKEEKFIIPGYSKKDSLMFADIASGVFKDDFGKKAFKERGFIYSGYLEAKKGIVDLQFAFGYRVLKNKRLEILVTVRGSKEKMDWATDLDYKPITYNPRIDSKITVHSGFLKSAKLLMENEIKANINGYSLRELIRLNKGKKRNDRFLITGHSLGGAVSTVYSTMLLDRGIKKENLLVYTFGAPPISMDEGMVKQEINSSSLEGKLGAVYEVSSSLVMGSEKKKNFYIDRYQTRLNLFRIYDKNDIVPKLIPPARHLGTPVMYGEKVPKSDLIDVKKMWRLHWMSNYKKQINNFEPQDPKTQKGGLIDLIK